MPISRIRVAHHRVDGRPNLVVILGENPTRVARRLRLQSQRATCGRSGMSIAIAVRAASSIARSTSLGPELATGIGHRKHGPEGPPARSTGRT
jgi:hypothetical protein